MKNDQSRSKWSAEDQTSVAGTRMAKAASARSVRSGEMFYPSVDDTPAQRALKFVARNAFAIGAVIVLIVVSVWFGNLRTDRDNQLTALDARILQQQQAAQAATIEADKNYADTFREATGGVDAQRKADDDALAGALFDKALTWDGIQQYLRVRNEVMEQYNFAENSEFVTVYMPGEHQGVARRDSAGKVHYGFDENISSDFDSIDTVVTKTDGDIYSYVAIIKASHIADSGSASATTYSVATYDVVDGVITNMKAHTVPGGAKFS